MNKRNPQVSVLIPVYNREKEVKACIHSIQEQTFQNIEIIIVDDNSTDKTVKIVQEIAKNDNRVKLIRRSQNGGPSQARNTGIKNCISKYIALQDSDDISNPTRISLQHDFLETNPSYIGCGTYAEYCDANLNLLYRRRFPTNYLKIMEVIKWYNPVLNASMMYRKEGLEKAGLYNTKIPYASDYDLILRIAKVGPIANIPKYLYKVRLHKKSITSSAIKGQGLYTFYSKIKAQYEYGYDFNFYDKLVMVVHLFGIFLIPNKIKFFAFNVFRKIVK